MSLLLEALKKAEKAKEDARRGDKGSEPTDSFSLAAQETRHVVTRDELPDITRSVDIESSDLEPAARAPEPPARNPAPREAGPRAAAARQPPPEADTQDPAASERATARKVFQAKKFREPNPKMPFYITMGLLSAFAIGTVGYFWYQLRPPPPLVNPNPPPAAAGAATAPAPASAPGPAASINVPPAAPAAETNLPGLPGSAPGTPAPAPPAASGSPATTTPDAPASSKAPTTVPAKPAAPAPSAGEPAVTAAKPATRRPASAGPGSRNARPAPDPRPAAPVDGAQPAPAAARGGPTVDPRIDAAYADYLAGRFESARTQYSQVLRDEPIQRDALLGLAATETRLLRPDAAEAIYQRMLRLDPRDAHAHAGLLALRGEQVDPVLAESRLKSLIAGDPESNVLQGSLGDQYARQGRWAEAQQAYFRAFAAEPDNPDYAYNLAVSLDHLRQLRLAAEYYRRALSLAERRDARFDREAARRRAETLSR